MMSCSTHVNLDGACSARTKLQLMTQFLADEASILPNEELRKKEKKIAALEERVRVLTILLEIGDHTIEQIFTDQRCSRLGHPWTGLRTHIWRRCKEKGVGSVRQLVKLTYYGDFRCGYQTQVLMEKVLADIGLSFGMDIP